MSILLASELASGGGASDVPLGTVVAQRGDGTVDVSVQGGLMTRVPVVAGARCGVGDVVVVLRRSPSQVVVLGAVRSEPTDDPVRLGIDILWNLLRPWRRAGCSRVRLRLWACGAMVASWTRCEGRR